MEDFKMGLNNLVLLLALVGPLAYGSPDFNVRYFAGTLNIQDKKTGADYKEKVVMYHLVDADTDLTTEVACVKDAKVPAYLVSTYMKRKTGNDTMAVSDQKDFAANSKLTGEGQATGKTYYWDKFTLEMKYVSSQKPGDFVNMKAKLNFVPGALNVKKRIWFSNGEPKQDWSGTLPQISRESFLKIASAMKCPAIP
jgi:hypothetical protein